MIKLFTMFEDSTVCLLYLLNQLFGKIHVFKPSSSKSGNSEVYVICLDYKREQVIKSQLWEALLQPYRCSAHADKFSMFHLNEIPQDFIEEIILCTDYFMQKQISTINENIKWFKKKSSFENARVSYLKTCIATCYINKYKINSVPTNKKIVRFTNNQKIISFYQQQWNRVNKWCFKEDFKILLVSNTYCNIDSSLMQIKTGKMVTKVLHSNFCSKENMGVNINCTTLVHEELYKSALKFVNRESDCGVISLFDLDERSEQSRFQKKVFIWLRNQLGTKNILFLKIPLVTNFLAQLIFLYMSMYKKAIFHKSGFIVFDTINENEIQGVSKYFDVIQSTYDKIDSEENIDILQLIPLRVICESSLYVNYLWNYNNSVFAEN